MDQPLILRLYQKDIFETIGYFFQVVSFEECNYGAVKWILRDWHRLIPKGSKMLLHSKFCAVTALSAGFCDPIT